MGQLQLRNGESGTWASRGGGRGRQILGIRAGGQVEGLMELDGTGADCMDLTLVSGMVREGGIADVPGRAQRPPSQGQHCGGSLTVHYPCTGDRVGRQVAGWLIS